MHLTSVRSIGGLMPGPCLHVVFIDLQIINSYCTTHIYTPRCTDVYRRRRLPSNAGGVVILSVALCYRNWISSSHVGFLWLVVRIVFRVFFDNWFPY